MTTILVTNANDTPVAGKTDLRQALQQAANGDTIDLSGVSVAYAYYTALEITAGRDITIENGKISLYADSVVVDANASLHLHNVTLGQYAAGGFYADSGLDGAAGANGVRGSSPGDPGGFGQDGGGATDGKPALITYAPLVNNGATTLIDSFVTGNTLTGEAGGQGGQGGDGGRGARGQNGGSPNGSGGFGGDGGSGGAGGKGGDGGLAVGGIFNALGATLTLQDSGVYGNSATGGKGGDGGSGGKGGDGGDGGNAYIPGNGNGGAGGDDGAGGAGADGGAGGTGIGGIYNFGTINVIDAAFVFGNTGDAGDGGTAGTGGEGYSSVLITGTGPEPNVGHGGTVNGTGTPGKDGVEGAAGGDGQDGAGGSSGGDLVDVGVINGSLTVAGRYYAFGAASQPAVLRTGAGAGSKTLTYDVDLVGPTNAAGSVHWSVVANGGLSAAEFVGGVLPSGTLTFTADPNGAGYIRHASISFQVVGDAVAKSFVIALTNPAAGDTLAAQTTLSQLVVATAAARDLNADGHSDILFRRAADGAAYLFTMNGATVAAGAVLSTQVGNAWRIEGIGDFDGNGTSDLLFVYDNVSNAADALNGVSYVTLQNGAAATAGSGVVQQLGLQWQVQGTGDFDGDGKADVLYRNSNTGALYLDIMNGTQATAASGFTSQQISNPSWRIAGVADLNGDGHADVLWRYDNTANAADPLNGVVYEWTMNGANVAAQGLISSQPGSDKWTIAGTGDFNGDGNADILFRYENASNAADTLNGFTYIDFMNGATVTSGAPTQWQVDNSWAIASIGDYNADGMSDILLQQASTGNTYIWTMNGANVTSGAFTSQQSGSGWSVQNGVLIG